MNPEISEFIMNFFQNMGQGGMMGGMNFMGGPPMPPGPSMSAAARAGYGNKLPQQVRPQRTDMYSQRPPQPNMPNFQNNPGFGPPGMMGGPQNMPNMQPQPGFGQMKMPVSNMGMMGPPVPVPMPPMNQVSEEAMYSNQYNEMVNSSEYRESSEDDKRNKFGDLIFQFVEKLAGSENAPKITGMIIDLDLADLEQATSSLFSLKEKISEGMDLLEEENE